MGEQYRTQTANETGGVILINLVVPSALVLAIEEKRLNSI